jgi:hypothetical protein
MMNDTAAIKVELPGDVNARIFENRLGFTLSWDDGLINLWEETYDSLALALMRLAALSKLADGDWLDAFTHDDEVFALRAKAFLEEHA